MTTALTFLAAGVIGVTVVTTAVRALIQTISAAITARRQRDQQQASTRQNTTLTAVAVIGTLVGMTGVGHAMYDALTPDAAGLQPWALGEAFIAALFLELVVATCAKRARAHAYDAKAARLDVTVVLFAAVLSGLVSGLHAGWGTAGLFRFAVPSIAAAVWLGDVVTVLREQRETDHERALRDVIAAVSRRIKATEARRLRTWRVRRADLAVVGALAVYAALDGNRPELVGRLDEVHHRADLLGPMGPSPWRTASGQTPTGPDTDQTRDPFPADPATDGRDHDATVTPLPDRTQRPNRLTTDTRVPFDVRLAAARTLWPIGTPIPTRPRLMTDMGLTSTRTAQNLIAALKADREAADDDQPERDEGSV